MELTTSLLGNEAREQGHRSLPESEARRGKDGGDEAADGGQDAVLCGGDHVEGEVEVLQEPQHDAHARMMVPAGSGSPGPAPTRGGRYF